MGNVSLWTCSVILLCLSEIAFGHRFPYENPSFGYRNAPSKLNLRNFLGSKLIQKLADNQNNPPQYEQLQQMPNPLSRELVHSSLFPPPPQPLLPSSLPAPQSSSFSRNVAPYEFQRVQVQALPPPLPPQPVGVPPDIEPSYHRMRPPPQTNSPPLPLPPPPLPPPPSSSPLLPPHSLSQQNIQENMYTETITSTCPCGACSECEAAGQDYSYPDEPCSSCLEGGGPCTCEECPCSKGRGFTEGRCSCSTGRCPCGSGDDASYPSEKEYYDREQNYDDYPASECPCCCECSGNQDCPCAYTDEQQSSIRTPSPSHHIRERPTHRKYSPTSYMSENYMEGPPEVHSQRHCEHYVGRAGPPPYKSLQPPLKEAQPIRYRQYEEFEEPPQYVKMPPQRTFVPPVMPPPPPLPPPLPPVVHPEQNPELPEEDNCHHVSEPQHPQMVLPEVPERRMHHTEISERTIHRYHEPASPMQPVEPCPMHPEMPRAREWRPTRIPPPGPPMRYIEEDSSYPELPPPPPPQAYRRYRPTLNRYGRKYRQPHKPPFFEGLSYTDGC